MASLIRCLNKVLGSDCSYLTYTYVDDLLVYSDDVVSHLRHLGIIFEKLRVAGLTVKLKKCQFFRTEIKFLVHR